jgi:predicted DCC family thiol-disulfide oxidoreductase YuxK
MTDLRDTVLVLYDGSCGFCRSVATWLRRRDRHGRLLFQTQQSCSAQLLAESGYLGALPLGAALIAIPAKASPCSASDAVIVTLEALGWPWRVAALLLGAIPRRWREKSYAIVASKRHLCSASCSVTGAAHGRQI